MLLLVVGVTHRHLSDHLSEVVENTVSDLEQSKVSSIVCIKDKNFAIIPAVNKVQGGKLESLWLTIFGTWVYHHERMCSIHSWYGFDINLWPQGQIYSFLSCLHVQPITFVCLDIGIPYLTHGSITIRGCVPYIHDPDKMLTFDLKVKFIG